MEGRGNDNGGFGEFVELWYRYLEDWQRSKQGLLCSHMCGPRRGPRLKAWYEDGKGLSEDVGTQPCSRLGGSSPQLFYVLDDFLLSLHSITLLGSVSIEWLEDSWVERENWAARLDSLRMNAHGAYKVKRHKTTLQLTCQGWLPYGKI
jgi:hypothetical protein